MDESEDESTSEEWLAGLIRGWRANHNDLRFGQWLFYIISKNRALGGSLYYVEDNELADLVLKGYSD